MSYRRPSTCSSDSFELIYPPRRSSTSPHNIGHDHLSSDEDQIVWNVMGTPLSSPPSLSDDDFILLNVPPLSPQPSLPRKNSASPTPIASKVEQSNHVERLSSLKPNAPHTHSESTTSPPATPPRKNRRHRGHGSIARQTQSPETSSTPKPAPVRQLATSPSKKKKPAQKRKPDSNKPCPASAAVRHPGGLGARSIVDDISEKGDDPNVISTNLYEQAVRYINWYVLVTALRAWAPKCIFISAVSYLSLWNIRQRTWPSSRPLLSSSVSSHLYRRRRQLPG